MGRRRKRSRGSSSYGGRSKGHESKPASPTRRAVKWSIGILVAVVVAAIGGVLTILLTNWFPFAEADLVFTGPLPPLTPTLESRMDPPYVLLSTESRRKFRNKGFKTGHLGKPEIVPDGIQLFPEKVQTNCDQSGIRWLSEKEIRCDFLIWVDPRKPPGPWGTLRFRIIYYDQSGKAIYREAGLEIQRVP
jgi:hypothetical protein